ncbi:MAG: Bro-N domain-containing protein [Candidatus Fonsibacter sp.]
MSEIVRLKFNNNAIARVVVNWNPWFKGKYIATLLDYTDTNKAIAKNVSEDDRIYLEELMGDRGSPIGYRDRIVIYI